jgi:nitrilase
MGPKTPKFKVAAAHAAPVFMNKAATIKKVISFIEQAANDDVKLVVFPETYIPGYPVFLLEPVTQLRLMVSAVLDRMLRAS